MAEILSTISYYYNDVNLIARPAAINSRSEVPKELNKIIVAPMESVVGRDFAKKANKLGLTICLHRFCSPKEETKLYNCLLNKNNVFCSIGLNDWERVRELQDNNVKNWLIDVANGYIGDICKTIDRLITIVNPSKIMVGNVMDKAGIRMYKGYGTFSNGNFYIRVGIAGGAACSTSDNTGYNRGQITEIIECAEEAKLHNIKIIADGGIKNGNYASKAFGAGADYVMMGSYFSQAREAFTHRIGDGTYWGGASDKQQKRTYGKVKRHSEGKVIKINNKLQSLEKLTEDLWGGLTSAVSYSGHKSLTGFIGNGIFEVKQNSLPPKNRE
jgi:IMP dehydrogenase/GMP reductase